MIEHCDMQFILDHTRGSDVTTLRELRGSGSEEM